VTTFEASAERGREELEPGDFTIAAVEDAARPELRGREQCGPRSSCWPAAPPAEPDEETHGRDHVRRHRCRINTRESATDRTRSNRAR